jgi:GNAT superfamily N-acetyltransferase
LNSKLSAPVLLTDSHDLAPFDSGVASLDQWLKQRALKSQLSGAARTYVLCKGQRVTAYYALASGAIAAKDVTGRFRRNMPDPIPVALLARLAVDCSLQGNGIGRALVRDAGKRIINAADTIGIRGVVVHALTDEVMAFYERVGFRASPNNPRLLMVSLKDLAGAL